MATHLLVNSDAIAQTVRQVRTVPPERITVIPNGVDATRFSPAAEQRRPSDSVIVGTLANLRPEKGVGDLIRASALVHDRCPGTRFVLWGEGPLRPSLEQLIRELHLGETVTLSGATVYPEAVLRELDVFVLPSLREGCSNALLEAMATGLPVVATHAGGNSALVRDDDTGLLVPPGDPAALAKAIIRLIETPALAAELAARARERVQAEFGLDRMLSRFEALYDQALARGAQ